VRVGPNRKLIEVALPLEQINEAAGHEKHIRQSHPSTLHLWWARRPLAAARAVIFASLVDDPSTIVPELLADAERRGQAEAELRRRHAAWDKARRLHEKATAARVSAPPPGPEPTLEGIVEEQERRRLFDLISKLVDWENSGNEGLLEKARIEIRRAWARWCRVSGEDPKKLPPFHDPFAGGGALPLEAQRLGLESHASDLNPVAVTINKAMIEIPPRFAGRPPVNPEARRKFGSQTGWKGAAGLAEDIRYYGQWVRAEAEKRIGNLYPDAIMPDGSKVTVIAWLWARTVASPNPAFHGARVPLMSSFWLSTKPGKLTWLEPVIEGRHCKFLIKRGSPSEEQQARIDVGTKLGRGANFRCILSDSPISPEFIKSEGMAGRMGTSLVAMVVDGPSGRTFLPASEEMEAAARDVRVAWRPDSPLPEDPRNFWAASYGLKTFADLFTPRQLVALTTLSDLAVEARQRVERDAIASGLAGTHEPLHLGGSGGFAYAEAIGTYLGMMVSRCANTHCTLALWSSGRDQTVNAFSRQSLPMTWDFPEVNPFCGAAGDPGETADSIAKTIAQLGRWARGFASTGDVSNGASLTNRAIYSTDPPYYDNISYADLSDFFYVWLRRTLKPIFPELFSTVLVPKAEELIASPYRHGSRGAAEAFFMEGMTRAMHALAERAHPAFPVTIYYAFKQSETEETGVASTGWQTFLEAVIRAGFSLTGTWPLRTERPTGMKVNVNALASSIVLVCRQRPTDAPTTTRKDFLGTLRRELPVALRKLQQGNIAPVDLAQASIGPGMAIYTRYSRILEADGSSMSVRAALAEINRTLDEVLAEQEGEFDADTGWAVAWFDQYGFNAGPYGEAEVLCKAKNTSVDGLEEAGIVAAKAGRVRLLRMDELAEDWDPDKDKRPTTWEVTHYLMRALESGEQAAASLLTRLRGRSEAGRELAYRLYSICERRKRAAEAMQYNTLVITWPALVELAVQSGRATEGELFTT